MGPTRRNTTLHFFVITLAVFTIVLTWTDHFFFKHNKGFSIWHLYSRSKEYSIWDQEMDTKLPLSTLKGIFAEPFTYLGRGHQSIVFESADHEYVLKLCSIHSHLRAFGWLKHPLSRMTTKRKVIEARNITKLTETKKSHAFAFSALESGSGIVLIHMNKSENFPLNAVVRDPLGYTYTLPLKETFFLLQKKGTLIFPTLQHFLHAGQISQAKAAIENLLTFIHDRSLKGIKDDDPVLEKNYGFYGTTPFQLDTGRLRQDETLTNKGLAKKETIAITEALESWLTHISPELLAHYRETLDRL
ncbi:MAG: hypothetical protein NTZ52_03140 [Chlamydiae bacterium]|nr:hypothetical protein [Chlamydiota bacterium]